MAILFGLSSVPLVLTRLIKEALIPMREKDARLIVYLDNIYTMKQSAYGASSHVVAIQDHLTFSGFLVNLDNSNLVPEICKIS